MIHHDLNYFDSIVTIEMKELLYFAYILSNSLASEAGPRPSSRGWWRVMGKAWWNATTCMVSHRTCLCYLVIEFIEMKPRRISSVKMPVGVKGEEYKGHVSWKPRLHWTGWVWLAGRAGRSCICFSMACYGLGQGKLSQGCWVFTCVECTRWVPLESTNDRGSRWPKRSHKKIVSPGDLAVEGRCWGLNWPALEDPSSSLASEMYIFHLAEKLSMQPAVAWMREAHGCFFWG